jgi:DNA-binding XRE family transcriptional regulator
MAEPRASRDLTGHTQEQAADLIGVGRRTWQDWERGVAAMPPAFLRLYRHLAGLERLPFRRQRRESSI